MAKCQVTHVEDGEEELGRWALGEFAREARAVVTQHKPDLGKRFSPSVTEIY